jgi:hypothetical protein
MKLVRTAFNTLVILSIFSQSAFADCDFSKGITAGPNKTFVYTEVCHQKVGSLVQDDKVKEQQIQDLTKAISLKDLALQDSDKRASDWSSTSATLEKRLQEVDKLEESNKILYFGLGVLTTFLAGYAAAKLVAK